MVVAYLILISLFGGAIVGASLTSLWFKKIKMSGYSRGQRIALFLGIILILFGIFTIIISLIFPEFKYFPELYSPSNIAQGILVVILGVLVPFMHLAFTVKGTDFAQ